MALQEQQLSAALEDVTRQLNELSRVLPNLPGGMSATATESTAMAKGLSVAGQAAGKMTGAFTSAMGAMYEGKKGLKAFDNAIDQTADALMILTGVLALVGGPITLLAAGLTAAVAAGAKYVKATNEQSDKLYDAFQQMSRSGGAAADGLQGLYNDVQKLGGGIQDLGDFVSLVASSSKDLATFGGSVYEGRREFARLGKEMEPFRTALMNSGMTQKEINEASIGYLRLQSRIGATQNRTTADLAESTRKYLVEQDALTKLLGMSRKEQEDQRAALQSQEIFQGKLAELRRKGQEGQADELQSAFAMLGGQATTTGKGFAAILSGNLKDVEAQKLYRATNGEARRAADELANGQITAAQAADRITRALQQNVDTYAETQGKLGNYNETFGDLAQQSELIAKLMNGGFEKLYNDAKDTGKKMGLTGDKALDSEIQRQTELRLNQQKAMQNMQDFVRLGVEPATEATAFFGKVIERITNLLPGSGKFAKEYEQEKQDKANLVAQEAAIVKSQEDRLKAQSNIDAAKNETEKKAAEKALEAATIKMKTAIEARDALKAEIAARPAEKARLRKETTPTMAPTMGESGAMVGGAMGEGDAGAIMEAARAPKAPTAKKGAGSGGYPSSGPTSGAQPAAGSDGNTSSPEQSGGVPTTGAQKTAGEAPIAKIIDSRPGEITVATTDGQKQKRQGAANWRMNNPGNLRMTPWTKGQGGVVGEGDAGPSGKFAVFSTLADGRRAKENLLFSGNTTYANLNLRSAMYKYAPPSDNNPTESYLQSILQATGASDTTKLAEMSQNQRDSMLAAIEKVEGFKPGKIYAAAEGGIVREKLGGTMVWAGEAGQDEAVVPLKNGNIPVSFTGTDSIAEALGRITDEFKSSLNQIANSMRNNQQSVLNEEALEILRGIESATKNSAGIQDQLLRVAQN